MWMESVFVAAQFYGDHNTTEETQLIKKRKATEKKLLALSNQPKSKCAA